MMCNTADLFNHLDTHMKVMMNQWKVIRRKKVRILTQCVSCKKLHFVLNKLPESTSLGYQVLPGSYLIWEQLVHVSLVRVDFFIQR